MVRTLKEDVAAIAPPTRTVVYLELGEAERAAYNILAAHVQTNLLITMEHGPGPSCVVAVVVLLVLLVVLAVVAGGGSAVGGSACGWFCGGRLCWLFCSWWFCWSCWFRKVPRQSGG